MVWEDIFYDNRSTLVIFIKLLPEHHEEERLHQDAPIVLPFMSGIEGGAGYMNSITLISQRSCNATNFLIRERFTQAYKIT